jgi:hypothetical protein
MLNLPSGLLPSSFLPKTFYTFPFSTIRDACGAHTFSVIRSSYSH